MDLLPSRTSKILFPIEHRFVFRRYLLALLVGVLAVVVRWLLDPVLGHFSLYATVVMGVAFTALVSGYGPAVVTELVGFLGVFYLLVDPQLTQSGSPPELRTIGGFLLVSAVLIALGGANRSKQLRLNQAVAALTTETENRRRAEEELRRAHDELEQRVAERTAQLSQVLIRLEAEVRERKQAEGELRRLSVRLMSMQDEDRRRIARYLHDSAGQMLSAIRMTAASLERGHHSPADVARLGNELSALADEALQEIRTTSYLLHPPLLDEAGIASAARWFVDGFSKRSGIQVHFEAPKDLERPPKNCELVLFRALQESLTNVHRHSGATLAHVRLACERERLVLEIADNGSGMHPDLLHRLEEPTGGGGVGIAGIRERVHELGGKLAIRSDTSGTAITVSLPARRPDDAELAANTPAALSSSVC